MTTLFEELNDIIKDLKKTKNPKKTCDNIGISVNTFYDYLSEEKSNIEPFTSFQIKVNKILGFEHNKKLKSHLNKQKSLKKKKRKFKSRKKPKKDVKEKFFEGIINKYISYYENIPKIKLNDEYHELMLCGEKCIINNEFYHAIDYFDKIISKYPNFEIFNKKGCLLIQLGEFENAIHCFDTSLEYQMKNNFHAHIGKSLAISNLLKLYECNVSQIDWDNKFEDMMNHSNVACLIKDEGYIFKAKILNGLGHYNGALDAINELLNNEILENELFFKALLEKSISFRQLGKYNDAIKCLNELLMLDEDNINVLLTKGELLFILKKYEESINIFNLVLEQDSENINALMYLGLIYPNFYNFDDALTCFDKILEIDNSLYNSLIYKAELLVYLHRYDEAIDCFNRCSDKLSKEYLKLFDFVQNQIVQNNQTEYYAVTKTDFANFKYVYTYIENGFRKIYGEDLVDLKMKVLAKKRLWANIRKNRFLKMMPEINENRDLVKKYVKNYYNLEKCEYDDLISSILNNDFFEKLDQNKIDLNELLNSKEGIEKDIINDLVYTMINYLNFSYSQNTTGYFGVIAQNKLNGIRWSYLDLVRREYVKKRVIYANTLEELEQKVKLENLLWYIFDEELARYSQQRDNLSY